MPEDTEDMIEAPPVHTRFGRMGRSGWALAVVGVLLLALLIGTLWSLLTHEEPDEPWDIDYPGVEVITGEDYHTEGERKLLIEVRFDRDIVNVQEAEFYLAALHDAIKHVYYYYYVKILNRNDLHVIDAVVRYNERHAITVTDDYYRQGGVLDPSLVLDGPIEIIPPDNEVQVKRPWEFDHPDVTWLSGKPTKTAEGTPYLRMTVRFEKDVVDVTDLEAFLDAVAKRLKTMHPTYRVKVFNRRQVHVLDGVVDSAGRRRVFVLGNYHRQEPSDTPKRMDIRVY